jgi:hypothetical protein
MAAIPQAVEGLILPYAAASINCRCRVSRVGGGIVGAIKPVLDP